MESASPILILSRIPALVYVSPTDNPFDISPTRSVLSAHRSSLPDLIATQLVTHKERKMKRLLAFAALTVLVCAAATTMLAQSTLVGTWKLNLEKSKYNAGQPPKSLTRTVESQGDKVKYTFDGVNADGTAIAYTFTVSYDGKDYPLTGSGAPGGADTITIKRITPSSYASVLKKAGQPVLTTTAKVSKDGKITTLTQNPVSGTGPTNTLIFEKQ